MAGLPETDKHDDTPHPSLAGTALLSVIAIGASAGGLEAVTQLIEVFRPTAHLAFILIQHSDPSAGSMMAALLGPHTELIVIEAEEGTKVEPGHLYINPPGQYLSVAGGVLTLSTPPARPGVRMPFDYLLQSLARHYGQRAACIVLSGTGTDGTAGLVAIKAGGGVVAVQDPGEAGYDGMPRSAVATGLADFVLPVAKIPAALCARLAASSPMPEAASVASQPAVLGLTDIIDLLHKETGDDFTSYKPGTLQRRVNRRIALRGLEMGNIAAYLAVLRDDASELHALARDLLIHVTSFFRDSAVFDTLARTTIPELVASHQGSQPLRVWVPGCSTGEETYSLAIVFLEQIDASGRPIKLQIFASDVDADAIATARDGAYPASIEDGITPARLARFFDREASGWRAAPDLRSAIVFTVQDVLTDPPFSRLDMISCRNLLIYLRPDAQARVLEAFHFALRPGGVLLLGSAENVVAPEGRFEPIAKVERLFRRIGRDPWAPKGESPRLAPVLALVRPGEERRTRTIAPATLVRPAALAELGRRLVMEAYAPASVLVDPANAVLFSLGPTDRYLRLPPGHATQDLLAMARPGLRAKLRTALAAARADKTKVLASGWIAGEGSSQRFSLAVHPVLEAGQELVLVCFLDVPTPDVTGASPTPDVAPPMAELQRELDATRSELQGTVRDLELSAEEQRAINEEALSVNEEYQSTNEELVASKEELQSLNEELTAVNSQLQETLERQRTTADDLQNVLFSTNVATLFLDLEGRIRFFTPPITAHFAVISNDVGRRLTDFAALAPDAALTEDIRAVLDGQEPPNRDIGYPGNVWYRRSILPYRAGGGRVEGVVITFTNITARIAAAQALEAAKLEAETANATKSRFLAAASHDLRQPLQTLALLHALLADTVTGAKAQGLVARQTATLNTVTGMLDSLLDINQIEAGAVKPDLATFPIGDMLERLRGEFADLARAKRIEFRMVQCSEHIRSDKRLLEQIVRNLLSNAIKYTVEGRILLGCRRHGARLSLEVWDTGIGMHASDLGAIFEEYYQVGNVARQRSRGLGLGLAIVKRLSGLLGHHVRVRSQPGCGSMFAIDIPLQPRIETTRSASVPAVTAKPRAARRILVVDDDPDVAEMLGRLLRAEGHQVITAHDGPSAMAQIRLQLPDLVVADYNLPNGPTGLELSTLIRAAAGSSVPTLILTGDVSHATTRAVAEAGCALLSKPASPPALRDAIARLLCPSLPTMPTVFVVDDDDGVRTAFIAVLEADGRRAVGYSNGEALLRDFHPGHGDCLLIDAALPGIGGIDLLEQLRSTGHTLPVIVVTGQSDVPMAIRAMKAGASDFIEKPVERASLLASIVHALEGSQDAAKLTARHETAVARMAGLTARQREIMTLVLAGHPSKNIAIDLGISQRTVENHRASIMHRTGAASLPALARLALAATSGV